jgi:ribosomal protein S18 acetylase RimI-like enzyme
MIETIASLCELQRRWQAVRRAEDPDDHQLRTQPSAAPPGGYTTKTSVDGPLLSVTVYSGELAARGLMAVVDGDAVMHDIHTDPAHRRRGLGSVVMATLSAQAVERGATTGLLNATPDGAFLYASLGWMPQATL